MKALLKFVFVIVVLPGYAQARIELCRSDNATVYSRSFKIDETAAGDNYKISLEIENDSFDNLYYSRKVRIPAGEKDPFIPPYLTVSVLNPAEAGKYDQLLIHGGVTMHLSTDSTQIFRITMKRNEHEFKPRVRQGEPPQLRCYFNEELIPWEQVKVLKVRLKP
jgi:hypothetical protein